MANTEDRKILVDYAIQILGKMKAIFPNAEPNQLEHSFYMVMEKMSQINIDPNSEVRRYFPDHYDTERMQKDGDRGQHVWHRLTDKQQATVFNWAMKAINKGV
jgi:hypothetical protein